MYQRGMEAEPIATCRMEGDYPTVGRLMLNFHTLDIIFLVCC